MRRNPLLYSDQSEAEEINTIEPIEEKRSFIFYFIVFANSLLVLLVLLIIWSLFSKAPNASFDQQIKTWTQQIFSTNEDLELQTTIAPVIQMAEVDTQAEQVATRKKELEQLKVEKDRVAKELTEQAKLESLTLKLQKEKDEAANEAKTVVNGIAEEAIIVPNAARSTPEAQSNTAKTQLEQILETMQNQNK